MFSIVLVGKMLQTTVFDQLSHSFSQHRVWALSIAHSTKVDSPRSYVDNNKRTYFLRTRFEKTIICTYVRDGSNPSRGAAAPVVGIWPPGHDAEPAPRVERKVREAMDCPFSICHFFGLAQRLQPSCTWTTRGFANDWHREICVVIIHHIAGDVWLAAVLLVIKKSETTCRTYG